MNSIRLTIALSMLLIPGIIWGQQYKTALGIRLAREKGISIQQSVGNKLSLEGLMITPDKGGELYLSIIIEKHINLIGRHFNAYVGVGPQVLLVNNTQLKNNTFGVNAITGLEWTLKRLNCSFDVKPLVHIGGKGSDPLIKWQPGITARYVLVRRDNFLQKAKKKIMRLI